MTISLLTYFLSRNQDFQSLDYHCLKDITFSNTATAKHTLVHDNDNALIESFVSMTVVFVTYHEFWKSRTGFSWNVRT